MADIKSLVVRLEADLQGLKSGMAQASGEVDKFTQQTGKSSTTMIRNWRMANQMGDSFRGAALQMGGLGGQGRMAIGVLDNLGDYFERAKLRGLNFRDALKNLSGEMSMMLTAGVVYGLMQAFNALQKSIEETNKVIDETAKRWDSVTIKLYERKLRDLKKAYDEGTISATAYKEAAEQLNESIIKAKYREEINKTTEAIKKLTALQERAAILSVALSGSQAGSLINGILGANVDAKISTFKAKLKALEADMKLDVEASADSVTSTLKAEGDKHLKDVRRFTAAEYELHRKYMDKRVADEQDRNRENRLHTMQQMTELRRIEEESAEAAEARKYAIVQEYAQRVKSLREATATSFAALTVSLLQGEANAWRNWANQVIAEIMRVIAKRLILNALTAMTGGTGGIFGAIAGLFGSPAAAGSPVIQVYSNDPATVVRVVNGAFSNASPGSQARLSQIVARGNIANSKR